MKTYYYFYILVYICIVLFGYFFFIAEDEQTKNFFSKYRGKITFKDSLNIEVSTIIPAKEIKAVVINDSILEGKHYSFETFDGKDNLAKYYGLLIHLYKKSNNDTLICTLSTGKTKLFKVPNPKENKYPDWW